MPLGPWSGGILPPVDYFLAPHNDDEALFGAYTLLRHRPHVIVCLRSFNEQRWDPPIFYEDRERETAEACAVLGVEHEQWTVFPDDAPDWHHLGQRLSALRAGHVWAPLPEPGGHPHHNEIGEAAIDIFPNLTLYATYTHARGKTTTGTRVTPEPGWEALKRRAMACYKTQASHPATQAAFSAWALDEYLTHP